METQNANTDEHNSKSEPGHEAETRTGETFVAPGIPVVRSNTPRPLSPGRLPSEAEQPQVLQQPAYSAASDFPGEAPVAPPLPEEYDDKAERAGRAGGTAQESEASSIALLLHKPEPAREASLEFIWLFEYGLEIDASFLNSPERLNGQALEYGPAVLTGYQIAGIELPDGRTAVTIVQSHKPEKEVWGILYRIPRRLTERRGDEPSILDQAHAPHAFQALEVTVREVYRKREVKCITYTAPQASRQQSHLLPLKQHALDISYAQRLVECARRHQLPDTYLEELVRLSSLEVVERSPLPSLSVEQNTEPLPVISSRLDAGKPTADTPLIPRLAYPGPWFLAFALYLVLVLAAALTLSTIQALGFWKEILTTSFAPLGAPWYMLLYGLIGASASCMLTLSRRYSPSPPGFVVLSWFARPYLGAVLAALAYFLLKSGLFVLSVNPEQRYAIFSLVGTLSGLCEGWIFSRQK